MAMEALRDRYFHFSYLHEKDNLETYLAIIFLQDKKKAKRMKMNVWPF